MDMHTCAAVILLSFCVMLIKGNPLHACINRVYFHSCILGITCYSYCVVWTDTTQEAETLPLAASESTAHATTQTHTYINPAISCLKKLHKTTTPTPHRKPSHHPRQLAHPGLIYIPLPLLLFVRPESSWGVYPKGGGLLKNSQVRPLNSGLSE